MLTSDEYEVLKKYLDLAEEPGGLNRPVPPSETMKGLMKKGYMRIITRPSQPDLNWEMGAGHCVTEEGKKAVEEYENR